MAILEKFCAITRRVSPNAVKFCAFLGDGLGKDGNQGLTEALKPKYKTGKEGMGFDLSKDLVDTWWTRAYSDSLNRIDVKASVNGGDDDGGVIVSIPTNGVDAGNDEMTKMRKRMRRANFTEFSKV